MLRDALIPTKRPPWPAHVGAAGKSVRCTETGLEHGTVRVEVEEGRVRVAAAPQPDAAPHSVLLAAGEAVTTGADGLPGQIEPIAPTAVAVWRQGRVAFNNTTLLRALIGL